MAAKMAAMRWNDMGLYGTEQLTFRTAKYAVFAIFSDPDKHRLFLA
jgi:hypothetical protein